MEVFGAWRKEWYVPTRGVLTVQAAEARMSERITWRGVNDLLKIVALAKKLLLFAVYFH